MWDIAAFANGTIGGSGYEFNISFTDETWLFKDSSKLMHKLG